MSDEQLAEKIQAGEERLFGELAERYEQKLTRYVRKFLANRADSEDIVQEVFIKAYRNIKSFDPSRKFSSWIYRIAHNEAINFLKKKKLETVPLLDLDTLLPHFAKPEQPTEMEARDLREMIDQSLEGIDLKYREPLILYYIDGFDYKEIAEILRIPASTVGVRLNRAKQMIKRKHAGQ